MIAFIFYICYLEYHIALFCLAFNFGYFLSTPGFLPKFRNILNTESRAVKTLYFG